MMHKITQIDDLVLDELVCGNLSDQDYRQVLRTLESQPERWRDCALAFLEQQALAKDLLAISKSDMNWNPSRVDALLARSQPHDDHSALAARDESVAAVTATDERVSVGRSPERDDYQRLQWMQRLTTIAALLLISFTVGWFGAGFADRSSPGARGEQMLGTGSPEGGGGNLANASISGGPSQNQALDASNGFEALRAAPEFRPTSGFRFAGDSFVTLDREMPDWLRTMERSGRVEIETMDVLMPMNLSNGTSALVPVQQYRVKPVVYSY